MTRWREHFSTVVAGLLIGGAGGFLLDAGAGKHAALSVASPAFADERAGAPKRAPAKPAAAPKAAASSMRTAAPSSGSSKRVADPVDRLARYKREPYYYAALGRRDPFSSLLEGDFMASGEAGLVDVGNIKLVGIAWDDVDRFAMVEDGRGFGFVLREGDSVRGGKVLRIERESVTFVQTTAGVSSTITIDLPIREVD